jgi:hypothetical protein
MSPAVEMEREYLAMHTLSKRLLIGFGAGALSHLVFQGALGTMLYTADLQPHLVWSLKPVPPFAVPTTINNMFWDGLWGLLYALIEPRLTPRLGRVGSGLALGLASLLIFWFIVLPLKSSGLGDVEGIKIASHVAYDLVFGIGTALLFWAGISFTRRPSAGRAQPWARG